MSLYDKYFSSKNKDHVYSLLSDLILKETGHNIKENTLFFELYTFQYPKIFEESTNDNLIDLNKCLLDTVGNSILRTIRKKYGEQTQRKKIPQPMETIPEESEENLSILNIYSSNRNSSSINRYEYSVSVSETTVQLQAITLPEENNSLFSLPTIQIRLSSQDKTITCLCQLDNTKTLHNRIYITYIPQIRIEFPVKETLIIHILNHRGQSSIKGTDMIPIKQSKEIQFTGKPFTCFVLDESYSRGLQQGDTLGCFVNNQIILETHIKQINGPYVLCDPIPLTYQKDEVLLINLSLQNHLSLIQKYTEIQNKI